VSLTQNQGSHQVFRPGVLEPPNSSNMQKICAQMPKLGVFNLRFVKWPTTWPWLQNSTTWTLCQNKILTFYRVWMHSKDRLFFVSLCGANVSDILLLIHTTGQKIANYFHSSLHTYSKRLCTPSSLPRSHSQKINWIYFHFRFFLNWWRHFANLCNKLNLYRNTRGDDTRGSVIVHYARRLWFADKSQPTNHNGNSLVFPATS
jgi:hypothetical protein